MKLRTIYRRPAIRPLIYVPIILGSLYFIHFATDLFIPMETTAEDRARAAAYLVDQDLPTPPEPFYQDGCTLWPDSLPGHDFREACLTHDIAYWAGGTLERQQQVNQVFRNDLRETGPIGPLFAHIMYAGVTYLGDNGVSRMLDTHWGYGWD